MRKTQRKIINGKPCRTCGGTARYDHKSAKPCVACTNISEIKFKEKNRDYQRNSYLKNRDNLLLVSKVARSTPQGKLKESFKGAKYRAKVKGLCFEITEKDLVIPELCPVFGTPLVHPSLDQHIPNKGYTKKNVRVISWRANSLKSDGTLEEFKAIVKYLENQINQVEPRD